MDQRVLPGISWSERCSSIGRRRTPSPCFWSETWWSQCIWIRYEFWMHGQLAPTQTTHRTIPTTLGVLRGATVRPSRTFVYRVPYLLFIYLDRNPHLRHALIPSTCRHAVEGEHRSPFAYYVWKFGLVNLVDSHPKWLCLSHLLFCHQGINNDVSFCFSP
jgi:hypothetical protein